METLLKFRQEDSIIYPDLNDLGLVYSRMQSGIVI